MKGSATRPRRPRSRPFLKWQLFEYFTLFAAILLALLWIFQTVFLDDFYQAVKLHELRRAANIIASSLGRDDFETVTNKVAVDNAVCVIVFDGQGRQVLSFDVRVDCLIHHTSSDVINEFYTEARENGGTSVRRIKRTFFRFQGESRADSDDGLEDSIVLTKITRSANGEPYIILLNTVIAPVAATVNTLRIQLVCISVVTVVLAMLLTLLMSRKISRPIVKLNRSAKALSAGQYDADFSVVSGCREVGELSDTLARAAKELSKVDRMQKELIANISHDLRTPLTLIKGYGEVMRDIPGEMKPENMQVIIDETERLSSLVNDLVDLSRLQAGRPDLSQSDFDLGETIRETLLRYRKLTERDGYVLKLVCDEALPVRTDRTRILQVIYNLINNAINYTGPDKLVTVRAAREGGYARVEVSDTGEGIEADKLPLIWDRYYKIDRVHRRAAVGTGLGLSIVKNILTLHGARYGVDSTPGKGSTFWFELPLRPDDGGENCEN